MDFKLESGNGNVDGQTNEQAELHQFRKELAMRVIYSIGQTIFKLESGNGNFDRFRVRVRKWKC